MTIKKKRKAKEFSVSVTCPKCEKWRKISMFGKSFNRIYFMSILQEIVNGETCHDCRKKQ